MYCLSVSVPALQYQLIVVNILSLKWIERRTEYDSLEIFQGINLLKKMIKIIEAYLVFTWNEEGLFLKVLLNEIVDCSAYQIAYHTGC